MWCLLYPLGNEVVKKVAKIIRHEDYKIGSYDADIALIKLESPVEYNFLIKPVCLPEDDEEEKVGKQCYVTGWGRLQEGGSTAKILQEARVWRQNLFKELEKYGYFNEILLILPTKTRWCYHISQFYQLPKPVLPTLPVSHQTHQMCWV